jgi:hypothetical protein
LGSGAAAAAASESEAEEELELAAARRANECAALEIAALNERAVAEKWQRTSAASSSPSLRLPRAGRPTARSGCCASTAVGIAAGETIVGGGQQGLTGRATLAVPFYADFISSEYYRINSGRTAFLPLFFSSAGYGVMIAQQGYGWLTVARAPARSSWNASSTATVELWVTTTPGTPSLALLPTTPRTHPPTTAFSDGSYISPFLCPVCWECTQTFLWRAFYMEGCLFVSVFFCLCYLRNILYNILDNILY